MISLMEQLPAIVVVAPIVLAVIVSVMPATIAWSIAVLATAISAASAIVLAVSFPGGRISYHFGGWAPPWGIEFALDHASLLVTVIIAGLGFVTTLAAPSLSRDDIFPHDRNKVYAAWLLVIGGLLGLVLTADAFNLFVFLEISSLASVTLVALGGGRDKRALITAFNYLVVGSIGATFYVIGVGFCYAMTGTLNMADLAVRLPLVADKVPIYVGLAFMVTGIMVKAAVFPVHFWLPPSYNYAPMAVTALLAAIATKASLYVLARIILTVFSEIPILPQLLLQLVLTPLALTAIFLGSILAIYEKDVKLMLAHSSVAQIGYIVLGFGLGSAAGIQAGFIHIANHAMIKGGMFIGLGGMVAVLAKRAAVADLAGLGKRMPVTAGGFLVCGLSLIGLPLTAGFISKLYLVFAAIESSYWPVTALILLSSALSVIYLWKIVEVLYFADAPQQSPKQPENPFIYVPLWILAAANIVFGIHAAPVINGAFKASIAITGEQIP